MKKRIKIIINGQVQGVGFRPFIFKLAASKKITGYVCNTSEGVLIEIQGSEEKLTNFKHNLKDSLPPLAKITSFTQSEIPLIADENDFKILHSKSEASQNVLVSPDVAICNDCIEDIKNPQNPRFGYAFTNCVNCGPRFTITRKIPYDRKETAMSCFELCENCAREYSSPSNRRFHAQPIACPECGPKLWFITKNDAEKLQTLPNAVNMQAPIEKAGKFLLDGKIVAIKGLGGFQLACDARNKNAAALLRSRKMRPDKAFALMSANLKAADSFCIISNESAKLMESVQKPVVLCPKKPDSLKPLADNIAGDTLSYGVMLPYTPLHFLLFDWLLKNGADTLVMTSANLSGEPICLGNREALQQLFHMADGWLLHDRDILERVDDSVAGIKCQNMFNSKPDSLENFILRRARGYVPSPLKLVKAGCKSVLGTGAELKSTFCITRNDLAFVSQHLGDLKNPATMDFYFSAYEHLKKLLETSPELIVHDLHPDFISSQIAAEFAKKQNIPAIGLQHHAAHAAAVMGENEIFEPALALCLDGAGLGTDKTIWGGEIIHMDLSRAFWQRAASLSPFTLPGGDLAAKEVWRIGRALQNLTGNSASYAAVEQKRLECLDLAIAKKINTPETTSCGRLFDGIASLLDICQNTTYEGQAAILLETNAKKWLENHTPDLSGIWEAPIIRKNLMTLLDTKSLVKYIQNKINQKEDKRNLAFEFHLVLAKSLSSLCLEIAEKYNIKKIGLTGGVFQNEILYSLITEFLQNNGLHIFSHHHLPCGDGCISFGQAVWGNAICP